MSNLEWDLTKDMNNDPDGVLIQIAKERDATLVTNDVGCKVRA
jgi:hypothetical protein